MIAKAQNLLRQIDWRMIPIILSLMILSLIVISSAESYIFDTDDFFTTRVLGQLRWFALGTLVFLGMTLCNYNALREWTWVLYLVLILALIGLFFTESTKNVQRWYRIPALGLALQPSEFAKLIVVFTLSWWLDRQRGRESKSWTTAWVAIGIVALPFLLIFKQPDLGTAMLLYPITLALFYFGDIRPSVIKAMTWMGLLLIALVSLFFLHIVDHEEWQPIATKILKEYQYERLNPDTHHQKASMTAIGVGGVLGSGWKQGIFMGRGWLPEAHTDSIFSSLGEDFGFIGMGLLLLLFFLLLYFSFQVSASAKDHYGSLLAAGIAIYLASHVFINIAMMCGLWPITGVPLPLMSYGGSSVLVTMAALGVLQSIYCRRFMYNSH